MANIYKRCADWVTGLRSNLFTWARIKLTFIYLLIIVIILGVFSVILYVNLAQHLSADLAGHHEYAISSSEENPLEDALERLEGGIITADIIVLLISGSLSYFLAGYTLKPIRLALNAQTSFSAEASHELRTPLAVMRTGIEVLLRGHPHLPDEAKQVLNNNLEEISLMSAMTEQLLELSRGKSLSLVQFDRLDLTAIIKNTAEKLTQLAAGKQIGIKFNSTSKIFVNGKKDDLERMLKNIITNAITYTPFGGQISVSLFEKSGMAEIRVADTGIGIAAHHLPHLFEAFYKADQARAAVDIQPGAGLGLAIVKQIVQQHRGTVEIKSLIDKGTTVIIRIPRA